MGLPDASVASYVEQTDVSVPANNSKVTNSLLGGTAGNIKKLNGVAFASLKKFGKLIIQSIKKINGITCYTPGSTVFYYHTEAHSTIATYLSLLTSDPDDVESSALISHNAGQPYPVLSLMWAFATEGTYSEVINGIIRSDIWGQMTQDGVSSSEALIVEVYRRTAGGTETLIRTDTSGFGNTTKVYKPFFGAVSTTFTNEYLVIKVYGYIYEIDIFD
jgi:hypothetical protein